MASTRSPPALDASFATSPNASPTSCGDSRPRLNSTCSTSARTAPSRSSTAAMQAARRGCRRSASGRDGRPPTTAGSRWPRNLPRDSARLDRRLRNGLRVDRLLPHGVPELRAPRGHGARPRCAAALAQLAQFLPLRLAAPRAHRAGRGRMRRRRRRARDTNAAELPAGPGRKVCIQCRGERVLAMDRRGRLRRRRPGARARSARTRAVVATSLGS